jgi:REase_DpnII-MboI
MPNSSRKGIPPQATTILPKLRVPRIEAQQKLNAHIERGRELAQRVITSDAEMDEANRDGDKWRDYTVGLLSALFDTSTLVNRYDRKTRNIGCGGRQPFMQDRKYFKDRMNNSWIKELESIFERLNLIEESPIVNQSTLTNTARRERTPQEAALEPIELITSRFHRIARQLLQRHSDHNIPRDTLRISDEYDVQDLFHALLRLFFDDVRDEEWTPSYAGGASRIDFLLKQEQVLVEIKMTRPGLTRAKDVSNQLIVDSERYRVHPDCKMLVAFVYDPQEFLTNPKGIEFDLTKTINDVPVKIIISQS